MENKDALQTVKEIKQLMEKSSRFLSVSGTSTILIGIYALVGAYFGNRILHPVLLSYKSGVSSEFSIHTLILIAGAVLFASLVTMLALSYRKSIKNNQSFFNRLALRTFINFSLPFVSGGIFCIAMIFHGYYGFVAPAMLLFYGLSLINVSKFTYGSIFWLGCAEIVLGFLSVFFIGNGLLLWTIGFGVLHIIYGIYFYVFVERKEKQS
ncbi:MAG: hypothetical protein Q4G48_02590 [Bacteroidia bacterium]|nr:hypothetical protein [Bacteroidia bacterium]